jgi:L-asparaginase II
MTPAPPLVVEAVRGELTESRHLVDVAVVDGDGTLIASAGDPGTVAYLRSSAKPIQATVCLELGWTPPGTEQLAVACASHNGEPPHVEAVRVTLEAAGLGEEALRCPVERGRRIEHNCSGKHAAMLAASRANGWDPARYLETEGDLQRTVRARIEAIAGRPSRTTATDGCGVPTFAYTLAEAAGIFARLPDEATKALAAMRAHPFLIAGSHRICTSVMSSRPEIVMKVGAEGLMCGVLIERGTAFALKARDGSARGREIATLRVLESLEFLHDAESHRIADEIGPRLFVGSGRQPELRCEGAIERA